MEQQPLKSLSNALEDHSAEGIAILTAEPSRLIRLTILVISALMVAIVGWAFIGRADVMVSATGVLQPEGEVRRFYAPIDGELVDLYVSEGLPVTEGDIIGRLNARLAIEAATRALDAEIELSEAQFEAERFPALKELRMREAEALARQIEVERAAHEKRVSDGLSRITVAQRSKLEEARANLEKASRARAVASSELQKYQRLFNSEGEGGVSRQDVETRRDTYVTADANFRIAEARFGELDLELSTAYEQARKQLEASDQALVELELKHARLLKQIENEEAKIKTRQQSAELRAQAAARVRFENIDEENFLRVLAPVSGVITDLAFTQPGETVTSNTPLGSIAPADARPVLKVEIPERDRGFLREGQSVKMKFNAFPYQRYGQIDGTLEYLAPAAKLSSTSQQPVYEARISLEKEQFEVGDQKYPLLYGMVATAEIVVRRRRLIDLALDPFRNI